MEAIQPQSAADMLGISRSQLYALAAPEGPIPCMRIGRRVIFDRADLLEYREKCRYIETKSAVVSSLNSTAASISVESGLESIFRGIGIAPKRTSSTGRKAKGSTESRPALSAVPTR
ncbi:helix-turn-helix domain-containing protein [Alcaligenaceae bacterium]|nr:helix-turn-helix domain-containing protein [Alcaligenaceae bacterium]